MATDSAALEPKTQAALALHRFGFGPRPGGISAIASDPRGAVMAELKAGAGRIDNPDLLTGGEAARAAFDFRQERKAARLVAQIDAQEAAKAPPAGGMATTDAANKDMTSKDVAKPGAAGGPPRQQPGVPQQIFFEEAKIRYDAALGADIGFAERLVWFWSNHFCVSADKGPTRALCGAYEREAIRPHILGKFSDMLVAVESHPAMLLYLDNARSIGPSSIAGMRQGKGLNENLAREILELHTLGVRTVYNQSDVTNFAKIITGWTIVPPKRDSVGGGEFEFNARMHEPYDQTVIGKTYPDRGFEQGRAVLADIARHPATAKHTAGKLAKHFVADDPPSALVDKLSKHFLATGGDLMEVTKTLVSAPESWSAPRTKLKKPGEWAMASMRANGISIQDVRRVVNAQNLLGEPLWRPPAPKGFPDDSAAWLDGVAQRLDIANQISRIIGNKGQEPDEMVDIALGPLASRDTREAVRHAESRPQAMALLLMAPEFQRR
jgi:uncharacterized protein (DUF1800 family)